MQMWLDYTTPVVGIKYPWEPIVVKDKQKAEVTITVIPIFKVSAVDWVAAFLAKNDMTKVQRQILRN